LTDLEYSIGEGNALAIRSVIAIAGTGCMPLTQLWELPRLVFAALGKTRATYGFPHDSLAVLALVLSGSIFHREIDGVEDRAFQPSDFPK